MYRARVPHQTLILPDLHDDLASSRHQKVYMSDMQVRPKNPHFNAMQNTETLSCLKVNFTLSHISPKHRHLIDHE